MNWIVILDCGSYSPINIGHQKDVLGRVNDHALCSVRNFFNGKPGLRKPRKFAKSGGKQGFWRGARY